MVNFSPIREIIDRQLMLDLGNPNGDISTKEQMIKENAISLGTLDYYRSFPFQVVYNTSYNSTGGNLAAYSWVGADTPIMDKGRMYIPFDRIFTKGVPQIPEEQVQNAYFLGIIRAERPYWNNYSNPSMWERNMFGTQITGSGYGTDIMQTILSNTYDDLSTGQPKTWINRMQNRVEILSPFGFGLLSFFCAIGFTSPEYVDMSRVDFLCKFISKRFIEAIIQARDGVQFDADFTISTEALQRKLERLNEQVDSIQNHSILHQAIWS